MLFIDVSMFVLPSVGLLVKNTNNGKEPVFKKVLFVLACYSVGLKFFRSLPRVPVLLPVLNSMIQLMYCPELIW